MDEACMAGRVCQLVSACFRNIVQSPWASVFPTVMEQQVLSVPGEWRPAMPHNESESWLSTLTIPAVPRHTCP